MNIQDKLTVSDSKIGGYIVVTDSSGRVVLRKDNMILENGRKFIRDKFIANGIRAMSSYAGTYGAYSMTHIAFGNDASVSIPTMTSLVSEVTRSEITESIVRAVDNSLQVQFRAIVDRTESIDGLNISEIGLVIKELDINGEETLNETLFSRVVFDTIPVAAGETYEVNYYIYF